MQWWPSNCRKKHPSRLMFVRWRALRACFWVPHTVSAQFPVQWILSKLANINPWMSNAARDRTEHGSKLCKMDLTSMHTELGSVHWKHLGDFAKIPISKSGALDMSALSPCKKSEIPSAVTLLWLFPLGKDVSYYAWILTAEMRDIVIAKAIEWNN